MTVLFLLAVLLPYAWVAFWWDRLSTPSHILLRVYRILLAWYVIIGMLAMHKADGWHRELQLVIRYCQ